MESSKCISPLMLQLIRSTIDNARSFIEDMQLDMEEEELENMTIKDFRNQLISTSMEFFGNELDPDNGMECPAFITDVIGEIVNKMNIKQLTNSRVPI